MSKVIAFYDALPDGSWQGTIPAEPECRGGWAQGKTLEDVRVQLEAVAKKLFGEDVVLVDRVM